MRNIIVYKIPVIPADILPVPMFKYTVHGSETLMEWLQYFEETKTKLKAVETIKAVTLHYTVI